MQSTCQRPRAPVPIKGSMVDKHFIKAATEYFASSLRISRKAIAATRVQRVWRGSFQSKRLLVLAERFMTPGVGVPANFVRVSG